MKSARLKAKKRTLEMRVRSVFGNYVQSRCSRFRGSVSLLPEKVTRTRPPSFTETPSNISVPPSVLFTIATHFFLYPEKDTSTSYLPLGTDRYFGGRMSLRSLGDASSYIVSTESNITEKPRPSSFEA